VRKPSKQEARKKTMKGGVSDGDYSFFKAKYGCYSVESGNSPARHAHGSLESCMNASAELLVH
jgi:hypothetical protein